ncbi:hypothetical protein G3I77_00825 [Streptomyces sp. D2-8]|uniref:hypothetical protein n=1 Tax=Streptomyces sp. D2-8 TaxID=2707767 RepID=UPI0020BFEB4E|nr:hypothetical protein [Streptomyces sp. D2-8]MCK8431611.1 hypothetical protein [Streptomyces sp. D2-8]
MRHITGRVRTVVSTTAAITALALPVVLGSTCLTNPDSVGVVRAGQAAAVDGTDPGESGELVVPKPKDPIDGKGSWVWDKEKP